MQFMDTADDELKKTMEGKYTCTLDLFVMEAKENVGNVFGFRMFITKPIDLFYRNYTNKAGKLIRINTEDEHSKRGPVQG